jgi:hypothetical protein
MRGSAPYFPVRFPVPFGRAVRLAALSLAIRAAVRFLAAAADAFFARAVLSSGVMASSERLPPIFPPFRPNLAHSLAEDGAVSGSMRAA